MTPFRFVRLLTCTLGFAGGLVVTASLMAPLDDPWQGSPAQWLGSGVALLWISMGAAFAVSLWKGGFFAGRAASNRL